MQRVQFQIGLAEPVAEFLDLRLIAIVEVLARAENLYRGDSGLLNFSQQRRRQPVIDEQMSGEYVIHRIIGVARQCPSAVPSVRGSGAPSSQPLFQWMAAASPCEAMRLTM